MLRERLEQHAAALRNKNDKYLTFKHCRENNHTLDLQNTKILNYN